MPDLISDQCRCGRTPSRTVFFGLDSLKSKRWCEQVKFSGGEFFFSEGVECTAEGSEGVGEGSRGGGGIRVAEFG